MNHRPNNQRIMKTINIMKKNKLWLCGITSTGNLENLKAMIWPIKQYFDGLIFTYHGEEDDGYKYLVENQKEGKIIKANWCNRHSYSQNHFLYQGPMQDGDHFILLDSMERISAEFCEEHLHKLLEYMNINNIAMLANYGKGFIFRFNEQFEFKGSPHWYATNLDGQSANLELDKKLFWNVRAEQRDKFQWVKHYAKYMFCYPAGSNHALLGLEKQGDPQKLFPRRESLRLQFRQEAKKRGYLFTLDDLKRMLSEPLDDTIKFYLNNEKTWNDYYRYEILNDETVVDTHLPSDMKKFD